MRIPRLYLPTVLAPKQTVPLDERTFNHAVRVLRLGVGSPLILFDGQGCAVRATLVEVSKRHALAEVLSILPADNAEAPLSVVLAQGISRGDKMDYTVQKAVELGVTAIQPLDTERSGIGTGTAALTRKLQHWRGVVIAACEQCGRNHLPEIYEPLPFAAGVQRLSAMPHLHLLLDPLANSGLSSLKRPELPITLLIGAEGGLSASELSIARAAGFSGVRFGPRILRTETAGIAALAAMQALWGDCG